MSEAAFNATNRVHVLDCDGHRPTTQVSRVIDALHNTRLRLDLPGKLNYSNSTTVSLEKRHAFLPKTQTVP